MSARPSGHEGLVSSTASSTGQLSRPPRSTPKDPDHSRCSRRKDVISSSTRQPASGLRTVIDESTVVAGRDRRCDDPGAASAAGKKAPSARTSPHSSPRWTTSVGVDGWLLKGSWTTSSCRRWRPRPRPQGQLAKWDRCRVVRVTAISRSIHHRHETGFRRRAGKTIEDGLMQLKGILRSWPASNRR